MVNNMSLLQQIKEDSVQLRKLKDANAATLITLYSECAMFGKTNGNRDTTDEECVKIVKKFIAGAEELQGFFEKRGDAEKAAKATDELKMFNKYVPQQMSELQLRTYLDILIGEIEHSEKNMGRIMAELKRLYPGQYDGALASKIVKEMLS
jgi:uncharacterized protein YqeY